MTVTKQERSVALLGAVLLAAISGLSFGYDLCVIAVALPLIQDDFNLSTNEESMVNSFIMLGAAIGALFGGAFADKFGRKLAIALCGALFCIGAIFMSFAPGFAILLIGRVVAGVGVGASGASVPVYISEISTPDIRGRLVTTNEVAICFGCLLASASDALLIDTKYNWRVMLGLGGIFSILQLLGMLFLPESPRWLLWKGDISNAYSAFRIFYPSQASSTDADTTIKQIQVDPSETTEKNHVSSTSNRLSHRPLATSLSSSNCLHHDQHVQENSHKITKPTMDTVTTALTDPTKTTGDYTNGTDSNSSIKLNGLHNRILENMSPNYHPMEASDPDTYDPRNSTKDSTIHTTNMRSNETDDTFIHTDSSMDTFKTNTVQSPLARIETTHISHTSTMSQPSSEQTSCDSQNSSTPIVIYHDSNLHTLADTQALQSQMGSSEELYTKHSRLQYSSNAPTQKPMSHVNRSTVEHENEVGSMHDGKAGYALNVTHNETNPRTETQIQMEECIDDIGQESVSNTQNAVATSSSGRSDVQQQPKQKTRKRFTASRSMNESNMTETQALDGMPPLTKENIDQYELRVNIRDSIEPTPDEEIRKNNDFTPVIKEESNQYLQNHNMYTSHTAQIPAHGQSHGQSNVSSPIVTQSSPSNNVRTEQSQMTIHNVDTSVNDTEIIYSKRTAVDTSMNDTKKLHSQIAIDNVDTSMNEKIRLLTKSSPDEYSDRFQTIIQEVLDVRRGWNFLFQQYFPTSEASQLQQQKNQNSYKSCTDDHKGETNDFPIVQSPVTCGQEHTHPDDELRKLAIADKTTFWQRLRITSSRGRSRKSLLMAILVVVAHNLTFANAMLYYSNTIFLMTDLPFATHLSVGVAGAKFLGVIIALVLISRYGRRTLLRAGTIGQAIGCIMLIIAFAQDGTLLQQILVATGMLVFIFAWDFSWAPLMWVICSEILPPEIRGIGNGIAITGYWITSAATNQGLLPMLQDLGPAYAMTCVLCGCILAFIIVHFWIPETKGLSLETIHQSTERQDTSTSHPISSNKTMKGFHRME